MKFLSANYQWYLEYFTYINKKSQLKSLKKLNPRVLIRINDVVIEKFKLRFIAGCSLLKWWLKTLKSESQSSSHFKNLTPVKFYTTLPQLNLCFALELKCSNIAKHNCMASR